MQAGAFCSPVQRVMVQRSLSLAAAWLVVVACGSFSFAIARAEENCLTAPSGPTPPGSHWYYHFDPQKQTKCWHLGPAGQPAQKAAAPAKEQPQAAADLRPHAASKSAPEQMAEAPRRGGQEGQAGQGGPLELAPTVPATSETSAPAASPSQASSPVWSNPTPWGSAVAPSPAPQPTTASTAEPAVQAKTDRPQTLAGASTAEPAVQTKTDRLQTPASTGGNQVKRNNGTAAAKPEKARISRDIWNRLIVVLMLCLLVAVSLGLLVRWLVRMIFARLRRIHLSPRESVWQQSDATAEMALQLPAQPFSPAPGARDHDDVEGEVRPLLRTLLRVLEQQAA